MKNGWNEIKLSKNSIKNLEDLIQYKQAISKDLGDKLNNKSDLEKEILKSTLRSLLRYSNKSNLFIKSMSQDIIKIYPNFKNFYVTPPYLMAHLSNDFNEQGDYHNDTLKSCGSSYTTWTPLNSFSLTYAPLSILNKSHASYLKFLYKVLNKLRLIHSLKYFIKFLFIQPFNLFPKRNCTYMWHSDLIHRGNLNKMEQLHVALVTRITEKPLYYEPTLEVSKLLQYEELEKNNFSVSFESLHEKISNICKYVISENNHDKLINYAQNLKKESNEIIIKSISFSLSILAQRFSNRDYSLNLDLVSLLVGKENLVSLERYLTSNKNFNVSNTIIQNLLKNKETLSYQENFILNKVQGNINIDDNKFKKQQWLY